MYIFEIRILHILNSGLNSKTASHTSAVSANRASGRSELTAMSGKALQTMLLRTPGKLSTPDSLHIIYRHLSCTGARIMTLSMRKYLKDVITSELHELDV